MSIYKCDTTLDRLLKPIGDLPVKHNSKPKKPVKFDPLDAPKLGQCLKNYCGANWYCDRCGLCWDEDVKKPACKTNRQIYQEFTKKAFM